MVNYGEKVSNKIDEYVDYIITNGLCTASTAHNKKTWLFSKLKSLDGIYVGSPSTHIPSNDLSLPIILQ